MKRSQPSRKANICVARGVPVFLLGIIGYASWVITQELCIDYLLQSPSFVFTSRQIGPAVAVLVTYYLALLMTLVCYARLIYVVTRYPGLVPRGPQWYKEKNRSRRSKHSGREQKRQASVEKSNRPDSQSSGEPRTTETVTKHLSTDADIKVSDFWRREVFTCGHDGRPAFCSSCYNWKPDRAHHCSELNRCVLKMDHFCPWVGGVVGETSFKFFIQFTFWGALYCLQALVATAYYLAQRRQAEDVINAHWAILLGISALFFLFSGGMCLSSLQFAFINSTTIENLSRKRKVWYIAVHVPNHVLQQIEQRGRSNLRFITYPRPPAEDFQLFEQGGAKLSEETLDTSQQQGSQSCSSSDLRTFAILETNPGSNPFDLGMKQNFVDMMGSSISEWFLPIRSSPYTRHDTLESFYKMGTIVQQLKREAKIVDASLDEQGRRKKSRRRRRKSTSRGRSHR